jgi:hypothetical protein
MQLFRDLLQEGPLGTGTSITILTRGLEAVSRMISDQRIEDKGKGYYSLNIPKLEM